MSTRADRKRLLRQLDRIESAADRQAEINQLLQMIDDLRADAVEKARAEAKRMVDEAVADIGKIQADAVARATAEAIAEIDKQILERDKGFSLDSDAAMLWGIHRALGYGKIRLERLYRAIIKEHITMRKYYEIDDTYPERLILKERLGVDVEALNQEFLDQL